MIDPVDAIIFDFDGVLIDSEHLGNRQIADFLSAHGHPIGAEEAMARFMGLSGDSFVAAIERWIGGPLPPGFIAARAAEDRRVMRGGIDAVAGAVEFVRTLPPGLPIAIASSSSTAWISRHLRHIGLTEAFGPHLYSGKEHVAQGKPSPDLYLHAALALGVAIERCGIIEDSPVGIRGALAAGGRVVGFAGGSHCGTGHDALLRTAGASIVERDFAGIARRFGLPS